MSGSILRQLRGLERAMARQAPSPEQRRRLRPIIDLLCLQLGRSISRPTAA
jgi:hypothetical protein